MVGKPYLEITSRLPMIRAESEIAVWVRRSETGCIPLFLIVAAASGEAKNR
jgi:hypothetical protein